MVYKTVSSDVIISKLFRDFKPSNSGWVFDALEWVGEGLEIMGAFSSLEKKEVCVNIREYKGKLPCGIEELECIEYQHHRLPFNGATKHFKHRKPTNTLAFHSRESCNLNPNYIQTTFEHGEVKVHFLGIPTDCNGLPMIPDNVLCKTALTWYCISMMLLRGFKHQIIDYKTAIANWEKYYPRAQNDMNYPDLERYEQFKRTWVTEVIDINKQSEFFNDYLNRQLTHIESGTITSNTVIFE